MQCYQNKGKSETFETNSTKTTRIEQDCKIIEDFELVYCRKFCLKIETNHGVLKTCGSNGGVFSKLTEDSCKRKWLKRNYTSYFENRIKIGPRYFRPFGTKLVMMMNNKRFVFKNGSHNITNASKPPSSCEFTHTMACRCSMPKCNGKSSPIPACLIQTTIASLIISVIIG